MADLPTDGYIPDAARTEGEMKVALEALRDVLAQMLGGGLGKESLTISSGVITPSRGFVEVDTEGGAATDQLVTIQTTNLPDGSVLLLKPTADARDIEVTQSGNIVLRGLGTTTLGKAEDKMWLQRNGAYWVEIYTFWKAKADYRDYLNLGDAAVMDQGPGNGLDADTVDGQHAADFLGATAKAADSDLLDGVDGANYARKDLAVVQAFLGNLRGNVKVIAYDENTSTPQFELDDDDSGSPLRRGLLLFDGTNILLRLYQSNGTTIDASLKITPTTIEWSPDGESTWYELLDEADIPSIPVVASNVIAGTPGTNYVTGYLAYSGVNIPLDRFSFFPRVRARWAFTMSASEEGGATPEAPDPTNPAFGLYNEGSNAWYTVSWEYLA